jgi:hypothetical protein
MICSTGDFLLPQLPKGKQEKRKMPINVTCPNSNCGQALSVQEQYAGMQGQCPFCKTVFTFPNIATAEPPLPPVPPLVAPVAAPPPIPSAPPMSASPPMGTWETAPPAPGPGTGLVGQFDWLTLILMACGTFFLFLYFVATMLPWITFSGGEISASRSGFAVAIGVILYTIDVLIMEAIVTVFLLRFYLKDAPVVNRLISYVVTAAAWLGTFASFGLLAGLFRPWGLQDDAKRYDDSDLVARAGFGLWIAFFSALFIMGIFGFLAFRRPPELTVNPNPNSFVRKWLLLVSIEGVAVFLGLLILLIHLI